ncbi:CD1247 N-terminal domain-containing protein [Angelakisella massiliensis]|uniref:CD1247 N-terminal domain-containing protein n=1 Tax=Angelakisella massiliensis TaxID=1871018 RepID=UPI0024B210D7|nr:CD1247 N-terminal domain-containing protein [Angelakisella massiliensis]
MMTITEKVAYLKGLADGLKLDDATTEGKILKNVIDVLEDMALTVSDLEDTMGEMAQQVDEIDDDLAAVEDDLYGDEDECDDEDLDGEIYEVECPSCGETVCIDEDLLEEGAVNCPNCGELLEFDLDDCECCNDECGCHDHKED